MNIPSYYTLLHYTTLVYPIQYLSAPISPAQLFRSEHGDSQHCRTTGVCMYACLYLCMFVRMRT